MIFDTIQAIKMGVYQWIKLHKVWGKNFKEKVISLNSLSQDRCDEKLCQVTISFLMISYYDPNMIHFSTVLRLASNLTAWTT